MTQSRSSSIAPRWLDMRSLCCSAVANVWMAWAFRTTYLDIPRCIDKNIHSVGELGNIARRFGMDFLNTSRAIAHIVVRCGQGDRHKAATHRRSSSPCIAADRERSENSNHCCIWYRCESSSHQRSRSYINKDAETAGSVHGSILHSFHTSRLDMDRD